MLGDEKRRDMLRILSLKKNAGFSMIELMIGIAILGVALGLGIPSYRIFIENTRIRSASESILNGLQVARAEAVKRNAAVRFVLGANSTWTVGCVTAIADLDGDGEADCPDPIQTHSTGEGAGTTISTIAVPGASTTVIFSNLGVIQTNPAPPTPAMTRINIDSTSLASTDSRDMRITIGAGGNAKMCDPSVALPDSRACQ